MKQQVSVKPEEHLIAEPSPFLVTPPANSYCSDLAMSTTSPPSMNLLNTELPIFEEATQTASHILDIPICTVGIPRGDLLIFKAAIGLSRLGLMNPLARHRRLPLKDELIAGVLQKKQPIVLSNVADSKIFSQSFLVQTYKIKAYAGVPLLTSEGECLGLLAAMHTERYDFSKAAIAYLELLARWSVSEYERYLLSQGSMHRAGAAVTAESTSSPQAPPLDIVRLTLMNQLTQDLRTPLTTITGMASMLSREIYGSLTPKQREYTQIVHCSSQTLLEIANEVLELSDLGIDLQSLKPTAVDFETLGQHLRKKLTPTAQAAHQEIRITVEPQSRIWQLDKEVARQLLHHLISSVIKLSKEGGTVRVHGSDRNKSLHVAVWVSHPWLGEGLPTSVLALRHLLSDSELGTQGLSDLFSQMTWPRRSRPVNLENQNTEGSLLDSSLLDNSLLRSREALSLLLSRYLVEHHGGQLTLQGNSDTGYRFLAVLPSL